MRRTRAGRGLFLPANDVFTQITPAHGQTAFILSATRLVLGLKTTFCCEGLTGLRSISLFSGGSMIHRQDRKSCRDEVVEAMKTRPYQYAIQSMSQLLIRHPSSLFKMALNENGFGAEMDLLKSCLATSFSRFCR